MKRMNKNIVSRNGKRKHEIGQGEIAVHTFGRTGKVIGKISGDTGYKDVSAKTAFIHYPKEAIAYTIDALKFMQAMGAVYIDVLDEDSGIHYKTTVQKYFDEGEYFDGGKWGEQLKLTLPNFMQTRDPNFTDSVTPLYSEPTATDDEVKPLNVKSRATVGIRYKPGRQTPKQLSLFGGR